MIISLPVEENQGLESPLSEHFGKSPYHIVVDSDSLTVRDVSRLKTPEDQHCAPFDWLLGQGVQVVLCKGMGKGALKRLTQEGVDVRVAKVATVKAALAAWFMDGCPRMGVEGLCSGHHHESHSS